MVRGLIVVGNRPHLIAFNELDMLRYAFTHIEVLEDVTRDQAITEGFLTINEAGVKTIHAFEKLREVFTAEPKPKFEKAPNWTPGQGAPLRRGRRK